MRSRFSTTSFLNRLATPLACLALLFWMAHGPHLHHEPGRGLDTPQHVCEFCATASASVHVGVSVADLLGTPVSTTYLLPQTAAVAPTRAAPATIASRGPPASA